VVARTPALEVPHPRLLRRPFALAPLLDVMPMALDPGTGEPYVEALEVLAKTDMCSLGPVLDSRATIA
jgi:7,8-dihydro-6-hydroxymethylpterin-pyrophosphokinase